MARPTKKGLDYFPMDCHMDKNIKAVIRKFNIEGLGVLVGLYQHIYSEGYWIEWNDETAEDFALEFGIDENLLESILCFLVKRNVFNKELFDKEKVLSSKGIQKRFLEATKRRTDNNNLTAYGLLHTETTQASELMYTETPLNGVNVCKSTQSKVKESKVKENKELTPQNEFALDTDDLEISFLTFDEFYSMYDKKVDKKKVEAKYKKISESDRALIKEQLPLYVESTPDKQFRKSPLVYLNGECWNDEIKKPQQQQSQKRQLKHMDGHMVQIFVTADEASKHKPQGAVNNNMLCIDAQYYFNPWSDNE